MSRPSARHWWLVRRSGRRDMKSKSALSFEWLRRECAEIKSRQFHLFESLSSDDFRYRHAAVVVDLAGPYVDFLAEFGLAKLFTDHRDSPVISVYPLEEFRRHSCADGTHFIGFGFRGQQSVWFDESDILSGKSGAVFTVTKQSGKALSPSFPDWLLQAYDWAKSKYSPTRWRKIVSGPPPFTAEQASVAEARKHFAWRHCGFAANGDALFEVRNDSSRTIPWLTIGIRDKSRAVLDGGAWLDIGHIGPGETAVVARDCYKDRIGADELEPFDLPEPTPEKRERYWEFGVPS
jgi:hypothetical protein